MDACEHQYKDLVTLSADLQQRGAEVTIVNSKTIIVTISVPRLETVCPSYCIQTFMLLKAFNLATGILFESKIFIK